MNLKASLFGWFFTLVMVSSLLFSANGSFQLHGKDSKSKTHANQSSSDHSHFIISENSIDKTSSFESFVESDVNEELDEKENFFSKTFVVASNGQSERAKIAEAIRFRNVNSEREYSRSISIPFYLLFQSLKTDFR